GQVVLAAPANLPDGTEVTVLPSGQASAEPFPEGCHPKYTLPADFPCSPEQREEMERWMNTPVSPAVLEAEKAYLEELPELLKSHLHQWVAYRGRQRLGVHTSQDHLYQECLGQGLAPGDFSIKYIDRPLDPDDLVV